MCTRNKTAQIRKVKILSDEETAFPLCRLPYLRIVRARQTFVIGCVDVMIQLSQHNSKG